MLGKFTAITLLSLLVHGCGLNSFYWRANDPCDNYTNNVVGYYDYNGYYQAPNKPPADFYFGPFKRNKIYEYRE